MNRIDIDLSEIIDLSTTRPENVNIVRELYAHKLHLKKIIPDVDVITDKEREFFKSLFGKMKKDLTVYIYCFLKELQKDIFENIEHVYEKFSFFFVSSVYKTITKMITSGVIKSITLHIVIYIENFENLFSSMFFNNFVITLVHYDIVELKITGFDENIVREITKYINKIDYTISTLAVNYVLDNMDDVFYMNINPRVYNLGIVYNSNTITDVYWDVVNFTIHKIKPMSVFFYDDYMSVESPKTVNPHVLNVPIIHIDDRHIHVSEKDKSNRIVVSDGSHLDMISSSDEEHDVPDHIIQEIRQLHEDNIIYISSEEDDHSIPDQIIREFQQQDDDIISISSSDDEDGIPDQVVREFQQLEVENISSSDDDTYSIDDYDYDYDDPFINDEEIVQESQQQQGDSISDQEPQESQQQQGDSISDQEPQESQYEEHTIILDDNGLSQEEELIIHDFNRILLLPYNTEYYNSTYEKKPDGNDYIVDAITSGQYRCICLDIRTIMTCSYICDIINKKEIKFLVLPNLIVDQFNDSENAINLRTFFNIELVAFSIMSRVLDVNIQSKEDFLGWYYEYIRKQTKRRAKFTVTSDSGSFGTTTDILEPRNIDFVWIQHSLHFVELHPEDLFENTVDFELNNIGRKFNNLPDLFDYFEVSRDLLYALRGDSRLSRFNHIHLDNYIDLINNIFIINYYNYKNKTFKISEIENMSIQRDDNINNDFIRNRFLHNKTFYNVEIVQDV
jgi:hypothetical protein